jgi:hypothetical protein
MTSSVPPFKPGDAEAVEQQFPRGYRGQGQGGGGVEVERGGLGSDDALVHQLECTVAAGTVDGAGVEHRVARLEQGHIGADRVHDAGGVEAQDADLPGRRLCIGALLHVDRVDRDRPDRDAQIARTRLWDRQVEVEQGFRVGERQRLPVADGLHACLLIECPAPPGVGHKINLDMHLSWRTATSPQPRAM